MDEASGKLTPATDQSRASSKSKNDVALTQENS